jgi:predicted RNA binding protein YcfA (HicA-like mRNA interferase family)
MTPKLPRITAAEAERALERAGFRFARQSGSYKIYRSPEGKRVTVPFHGGKILHPKFSKASSERQTSQPMNSRI